MLSVISRTVWTGFFLQNWRLYVWELDIKWLSITVVDVVNITNKHRCFSSFFIKCTNQSNTRQSFAIKSDVNKRANACIEILRQRNIKKATQYWPQKVDIGFRTIWSLGDHCEQCLFITFVNSACCGFCPYNVPLVGRCRVCCTRRRTGT